VAEELGADHVVEGSVRRSNERVRVTAQLLKGADGTHIWADSWDRKLSAGDLFDIQDEITNGIVGAIAGVHGAISRTAAAQARQRPESLTSYECVLVAHAYERKVSRENWTVAKNCLETVLTREPNYVDALSAYTLIAADAYAIGKTLLGMEDSEAWLDKALNAGERAVKLAPEDANSHRQLAFARFVAGDIESFRDHAERALALNPYDANVMGDTGTLLTFSGSYDRGLKLILEAIDLNPHHPEWWNLGVFRAHWMNDRLQQASDALGKIDEPDNFWPALWRMVIAVELEDEEAATTERAELERRYPGFSIDAYRQEAAYWHHTPEFVDRTVAVLRKAGVPESSE
jgi:adenylate cyclase